MFSHFQSSCCKPPSECGFNSQNATFWIAPKTGPAVDDSDCKAWKNQQQTLCFDCNACKAGFVDSIRSQWENLLIANLCALVFLIFTYIVGCRAKRNNSTRDTRKFYRWHIYILSYNRCFHFFWGLNMWLSYHSLLFQTNVFCFYLGVYIYIYCWNS